MWLVPFSTEDVDTSPNKAPYMAIHQLQAKFMLNIAKNEQDSKF